MNDDRYIIFGRTIWIRALYQHSFPRVNAVERVLSTESRDTATARQSPKVAASPRERDISSDPPWIPHSYFVD